MRKEVNEFIEKVMSNMGESSMSYEVLSCAAEFAQDVFDKTGDEKCYVITEEIKEYLSENY